VNQLRPFVVIGAALFLLGRNLPAALLALFPALWRVRETDDDGSLDPETQPATEKVVSDLRAVGFDKLGAIEVRPPLSRSQASLVYGASELHTFADLDAHGGSLRVTLFTPFEGGQAVLTSDHARPGRSEADMLIGGLPGHDVPGLWAVHRRRVSQLAEGPLRAVPWSNVTIAGRVEAERRFYGGAGKRLLRSRGILPVLMLVTALLFGVLGVLEFVQLRPARLADKHALQPEAPSTFFLP
jgi:hypothetical protein